MTNRFANGKRRADDAFQQTLEYGAAMPSYDENATNWESRQKERMRGRRVLARFGFGKRDMSLTFIIDETFRNVRAAEKMGDQNALWAEYYKLLRAHLRRRRKSLAESREHSRNRKEVTEYGQLKQVSPSFVTRLLMGTNGKPFDVEYAKRQIDHKAAENNPPEPDKSKCYEDGFKPNIAAATALANAEAERLRQVEADNAAARALADELFPRDNKQEDSVSDINETLGDVAAAQADEDKPLHFSQVDGFYSKVAKRFQKRKDSAVIKDYMQTVKNWFERASFTEFEMTEDAFFAMLDNELMLRFDKAKPAETKKIDEKATKLNDNPPVVPDTPPSQGTSLPDNVPSSEPANVIPFPQSGFQLPQTVTGISILNIGKELNKHLPPEAYGAIKYGQMSGKTDVDGKAVRDRFDQVFGPLMWRIVPHALAGRVEYSTEVRTSNKGVESTWHICTLVAHQFQYAVIMPDGSFQWIDGMVTSDLHDNTDQQYCYRGAVTSIMKQFYGLMGGMNHIYNDEYTHVHAEREIAQRNRKAS